MAFKIVWTPKATETFDSIIQYLNEHWTDREIEKFVVKADRVVHLISIYPKSFLKSERKGIFKARLNKQNSLFYRFRKNQVELLLFWDGRQDPGKLKKLLK